MRVHANVFLPGHTALDGSDAGAAGNADLRLDQIDPRHTFGDGVLHLNPRIDFDEIKFAAVGILQELDRPGRPVGNRPADLERRLAQVGALRVAQKRRGRALDDLLITALYRAVALVQVHQVAVGVAHDLHFHMTRAADQLLEIHLVLAEGSLGFAPGRSHRFDEFAIVLDDAHAAAAPAPAGLEHDGKPDGVRHGEHFGFIGRQWRCGRHHRHACAGGQVACLHLVAEPAHGFRKRSHEYDARSRAGFGEFRTLG